MITNDCHNSPSTVIIIPAFNEANTVGILVKKLKTKNIGQEEGAVAVVVVDDASTDGTAKAAMAEGAVVLPHTLHSGAWGAIRTGFRYAIKYGYRIAVTMDADGQHIPSSIKPIVDPVKLNQADVVIGACPFRASTARRITWTFFRKFAMLEINDITSGLRAYNHDAICSLMSSRTTLLDYQDIGVLIYLQKKKFTILEIPVKMRQRTYGHSKIFSSWFAVFKYLVLTGILCLSKLR